MYFTIIVLMHIHRCSELQDQVKRSQYEMEQINLQLMDAVKHKFRLQLEVEKWEVSHVPAGYHVIMSLY